MIYADILLYFSEGILPFLNIFFSEFCQNSLTTEQSGITNNIYDGMFVSAQCMMHNVYTKGK